MAHKHLMLAEATLASLAPGGDAVAHVEIDGERRAVFVSQGAPGDRVRLEIDAAHRPARGRIIGLITAGPGRVPSPCAWSSRCGGCDWMHLSTGEQEHAHAAHVRAALPASFRDADIHVKSAAASLAYRTRARVHVRCGRGGHVAVGMHEAGTHEPVEVGTCAVLDPAVEACRGSLEALFRGSKGRGEVSIALGVGRAAVIDVHWTGEVAAQTFARLERAVSGGAIAGAQVTEGSSRRPARVGDPTPWMAGADGQPLRLSSGGFGQSTDAGNAALGQHVQALVRQWAVDRAVELYAGAGNLSVVVARDVGELICVETDREACEAARANLAARALEARVVESDAENYAWSAATKLIVLDPPRAGARRVAERAATSRVSHIVYVSCDAQTLGRDLGILESAYFPSSIATFEMFPQTSHVETVVALERRAARAVA